MNNTISSAGEVRLVIDDDVATITFDRQQARNALTWSMYQQLAEATASITANEDVRVAVLRGAGGKAFVAGTDIEQFRSFSDGADGVRYEAEIAAPINALAALPVPTVAVVEGWAVGAGMAIASVCDFRICSPGARFGVPVARTLGNCLSAANLSVLVDMLGHALVKRMMLLAELIPAEQLTACGYITTIAPAAQLDQATTDLCQQLASHAPVTMAVTKQALARIAQANLVPDQDLVERAYGSADFHEGVDAFVNKRAPLWRGC